jgi:hypothetical protein
MKLNLKENMQVKFKVWLTVKVAADGTVASKLKLFSMLRFIMQV